MIRIVRSYPAPESLATEKAKANGTYNTPEVTTRLSRDFMNKCYICEINKLQAPEIEHLLPHKGGKNRDRMFDWENLFWACNRCNNIKKSPAYDEGIIDCCKDDPEQLLFQRYEDGNIVITEANTGTSETVSRTVMLLNEVYNKKNTGIRIQTCKVYLDELSEEMNAFLKSLEEYGKDRQSSIKRRSINGFLSRSAPFAAFKRQYVRDKQDDYPELQAEANS